MVLLHLSQILILQKIALCLDKIMHLRVFARSQVHQRLCESGFNLQLFLRSF